MKHVRFVSRPQSLPVTAANLLEKQHYLGMLDSLATIAGTLTATSQSCIQFKVDLFTDK